MVNKVEYVPAGCEVFGSVENSIVKKLNVRYMLLNASSIRINNKYDNWFNDIRKNKKIFIDSGGFQLATGAKEYMNPRKVIEIQNSYSDMGFMLDVPPFEKTSGTGAMSLKTGVSGKVFNKCIELTSVNLKDAERFNKKFRYYFILQGERYGRMKKWYNKLYNLDKFEGFSIKGTNIGQLISGLIFYNEKIKNNIPLHALGVGSFEKLSILHYFSKLFKIKYITYDNTKAVTFASMKRIILPYNFQLASYKFGANNDDYRLYNINLKNCITSWAEALIVNINSLHDSSEFLNYTAEDIDSYKEFVLSIKPSLRKWFEIIDYYFDNGINVFNKFRILNDIDEFSQTNIFSYL